MIYSNSNGISVEKIFDTSKLRLFEKPCKIQIYLDTGHSKLFTDYSIFFLRLSITITAEFVPVIQKLSVFFVKKIELLLYYSWVTFSMCFKLP